MEQLSFVDENLKESATKQMQKAIKKGIIPGAIVIFDDDQIDKNVVMSLGIGHDDKISAVLINLSGKSTMSWPALSDRLKVVGYFK